ncbi:MAG: META domain-containing protein [Xanthomonadales bacterium]|nr:META domain-containing protein [Xanthomonadales bacterium]
MLGLLLAACTAVPDLSGGRRSVVAIDGEAPVGEPWIQFDRDDLSGSTGCNSFRASYDYADGQLSVGPIAATKRFCRTDLARQESRVFEILGSDLTVRAGSGLLLESESGSLRLANQ